ncbi:glycoside hydrolase family 31 protein [bacterium]|nr:MAG: glycoside hydrolase family 31 protein [bacterium]
MKTPSVFHSIALHHQPYGEQHPYDPLPCERFPRDPSAGQPVTLGVETGHIPTADTVWCTWQVEGNPMVNRTDAGNHTAGETTDLWQVHLPAFSGGEVVHYRMFARGGENLVESEEFTFSVSTWVDVVSIVAVEENTERLVVKMATSCPNLSVRLHAESDSSGTISLRLSAFYENNPLPSTLLKEPLTTTWGDPRITMHDDPLRIVLGRDSDGLMLQNTIPMRVLVRADGTAQQYQFEFESPSNEAFYGFGERFNALDQRGNYLDNYVYGQYTSQEKRSYIPIPFFISSRGYGLWLKTERQAKFDLAAADSGSWTLTGYAEEEDASLEMKFFFQQHPRSIVQAFTDLTGKPQLPPPWAFGLWMSSNDWNSQAEVMHQLQLAQKHQIPATVLVIEAWSDEINFYIWNDAQYQQKPASQSYSLGDYIFPPEGRWPDPKAMVDKIHQAGLRLVLWQNPVIKHGEPREHLDETQNKADQGYAIQQGYVVRKADGSPHRVEPHMPWFSNSLVLDFTNQKAADWWFKKREYLLTEMGVDGFKTDGGEHIWDTETQFNNSMRGSRGINYYPAAYESSYRRFLGSCRGEDHVLFSRAGYTGVQQFPCHWAGDENSTWDAFRASLRAMLNVGMCGVPFMGWDIAGFAGPIPSSELYLRATAFSVFCPIMQYHSDVNTGRKSSRDRTPWNIQEQTGDSDVIPIFQHLTNLRMNLIPYILGEAHASSQSGLPLMRALPLEYPADATCREFPYEYMFGEALLVAPIVEPGKKTWQVYLPEGDWRDLWTSEMYTGLQVIETPTPLSRIPVFQRKGTILPLNLSKDMTLCSPVGNAVDQYNNLCLFIYPDGDCETRLYNGSWVESHWVKWVGSKGTGQLEIDLPPMKDALHILLLEVQAAEVLCAGKPLHQKVGRLMDPSAQGWTLVPEKRMTQIDLPAGSHPLRVTVLHR